MRRNRRAAIHCCEHGGMDGEVDMDGRPLAGRIDRVVFAVTSADHSLTRRNPLPFFARAMALHELGANLGIDLLVYGIPEAGNRSDFAEYAIKTIFHESEAPVSLTPDYCVVACATGVADLYRKAGFRAWGRMASSSRTGSRKTSLSSTTRSLRPSA